MMKFSKRISFARIALGALLGAFAWSCSGGGGGGGSKGSAVSFGNADLLAVESGRLVDVYGVAKKKVGNRVVDETVLVEKDVVIGTDIKDDVRAGKLPSEVVYRFASADPATGQEKLVIQIDPQLVNGVPTNPKFLKAFDKLDDHLKNLGASYYGQDVSKKPFDVAPRNGAIRLTFSKPLGLSQDFFTVQDKNGRPIGLRNTRAVQLLEIQGDPSKGKGSFKIIPIRVVYKGNVLVLDPVILGEEGPDLGIPNNATGLPASSPGSTGANIRLALPLEGAIRIKGLREQSPLLVGFDAYGVKAVIRDFRSGNKADKDPSISNGFLNDPVPPRIVGESLVKLLAVEKTPEGNFLTIYQDAMKHTQKYLAAGDKDYYSPVEIDPFDVFKQVVRGKIIARANVVAPPTKIVFRDSNGKIILDKYGQPKVYYRVKVDNAEGFRLDRGPDGKPLPTDVIQVSIFEAQKVVKTKTGEEMVLPKDDPRYFLTFSPPAPDPRYPTDNISPFASVIVRFTKPVDMATLRAFDTLILSVDDKMETVLDPQKGTAGLIVSRIYDEDGAQRVIRSQPPLGFYHDIKSIKGTKKGPWDPSPYRSKGQNPPDPPDLFYLYMLTDKNGVKDLAGNPVDLQGSTQTYFRVDFTIQADAPTNRVANVARRFLTDDEDPNPGVKDWFGAGVLLPGGRVMGRPTTRFSSYVDNLNQVPEPSAADLKFCPPGTKATPTASVVFGAPIQNPLNPMGCRLQTCWREVDLSLSRLNPFDYDLDVEGMWWAPFRLGQIFYDVFDKVSLYVHHAEYRPSPCVGMGSSLPQYPNSGLHTVFKDNYLDGSRPVPAFEGQKLEIRKSLAVFEPHNKWRYLPFPEFKKPYLTFRDERDMRLGGGSTEPVLSPFITRGFTPVKRPNFRGSTPNTLPVIALPLLADFFVWPDDPLVNGKTNGANGWQIAIAIQSSPRPNFRVYSGGGYRPPGYPNPPLKPGGQPVYIEPDNQTTAQGGFVPSTGASTPPGDNSVYWIRVDFLKRISVLTYGFVKIHDPNAAPHAVIYKDPRLGHFPAQARPQVFDVVFEPPLPQLPQGTRIVPQYRSAETEGDGALSGNMLNPLAAWEAHIFSPSEVFFKNASDYLESPNDLLDPRKLKDTQGNPMDPSKVNYFNWRLVFENNVEVEPPVVPVLDSMGIVYRFDR